MLIREIIFGLLNCCMIVLQIYLHAFCIACNVWVLNLKFCVFRSEIIVLRSERDKSALEANFAREKLNDIMKEFEHQAITSP